MKFNSSNRKLKVRLPALLLNSVTVVAMSASLVLSGCASFNRGLKGLVNPDDKPKAVNGPKYSDQDNIRFQSDRKYRRMNKSRFEDEAEVSAQAGSLWVMEGQGAYLFAQNKTRMMGDLLNVKIDGGPKTQLQSKVKVISKLLERLEAPQRNLSSVNAAKTENPQAAPVESADAKGDGSKKPTGPGGPSGGEAVATAEKQVDPRTDPIGVIQNVPTRIVEQLKDGSYRVKGMQPFMIGKREYKVIVTGVVRPEDFDDGGIDSSKLLDSQFDIVSSRKGTNL